MDLESIVHINNLVKSFGTKKVIDGISLSLFPGENLVLLGKSGSGKSVIVKCIVKLMEPDSGVDQCFWEEYPLLQRKRVG